MSENYIWNPCIEVESAGGTREVSIYTKQLMNRNIFLHGEINSNVTMNFLNQLMYLKNMGDDPVNIFINSPGGEIDNGLVIYDLIQGANIPINMYCTGMAASMAPPPLPGGQCGRRFILPHSNTMIHEPLMRGGVGGSATSIRNISESILETKSIINGILAKHTGRTLEEIDKATSYDNYMNAEESVRFGLCDEIKNCM